MNGRRVKTGAFLDTGSTHSFITRQLVSDTGMSPASQMSMTVSTIANENNVRTCMVPGVVIENEEAGAQQELYALDSIPVTQSDIPSAGDLSKWPYLLESGVTVPDQASVPVGIGSIGSNTVTVLEPLPVVRSEDGGPYAALTRHGFEKCEVSLVIHYSPLLSTVLALFLPLPPSGALKPAVRIHTC